MVDVPSSPVTFAGGFAQGLRKDREVAVGEERNEILREQAEQAAAERRFEQRKEFIGDILGGFDELVKNANDDPLFGRSEVPGRLFVDLSKSVDEMTTSRALDPDEVEVIDRKRREAAERLSFMRTRPTPIQQEIAEAEKIIGAQLTPEQIATKLGLDPKGSLAQAATFINTKRSEEGQPPLTARQIENMHRAEQAGLSFQVSPDGTILVSQGLPVEAAAGVPAIAGATAPAETAGATLPAVLPAGLRIGGETADEIRAGISVIDQGNRLIDHLVQQGQENPEIFGLTGTARGVAKRGAGLAKDVAATGLSVLGFDAQSAFEWLNTVIDQDVSSEAVKGNLRPANPGELVVFEKILQYATARALQPEGRLLASSIEAAAAMTKLTGFRSSQEVMDQLVALKVNNEAATNELRRRFQSGLTGQTTIPSASPVAGPGPGGTAGQPPKRLRFNPATGQVEPVQ